MEQLEEVVRQRDALVIENLRLQSQAVAVEDYVVVKADRDALLGKLGVVRERVEKAPHADNCASHKQVCLTCGQDYGDHYGENCAFSHELDKWKPSPAPMPCNCWKRDALAAIDSQPAEAQPKREWRVMRFDGIDFRCHSKEQAIKAAEDGHSSMQYSDDGGKTWVPADSPERTPK